MAPTSVLLTNPLKAAHFSSFLPADCHIPHGPQAVAAQALWKLESLCPSTPVDFSQVTRMTFLKQIILLFKIIQWLPTALGRSSNTLAYRQCHTKFSPLLPIEYNC